MGLGLQYGNGEGGDFTPWIKYDARAGRIFRNDRVQNADGSFSSEQVDITQGFKAVFDFQNIEVGFLMFAAGGAPQYQLVPLGAALPPKPTDGKWKQGVRFMLKLGGDVSGSQPVRHITSNAAAFLRGVDELHSAYEASVKQHAGKLPIVVLKTTTPVTTGQGDKKSTNYQPVFEISGWAPRPKDLVFVTGNSQIGDTPANQSPTTAPARTPPATGSTQVAPPKQAAVADAEDFG